MHQSDSSGEPRLPAMQDVLDNMERVMVGKADVIRLLFTAILAGGHCLIEDVPGVGKTLLAKAAAITCGCQFQRIQFTPDLLPSDVTGVSIYNSESRGFEFRKGPIFGQVVLADEINRTAPRTQSALLEAMEEHTVTVDGEVHALPEPFFVLATQNPLEFEATYPLPEAQLDRFLMRIHIGYPSLADEIELLNRPGIRVDVKASIGPVLSPEMLLNWQSKVRNVHVDAALKAYIVKLIQSTRSHPSILLGASPRAGLGLLSAAQALAFVQGRPFVVPDDILDLLSPVLGHRLVLHADANIRGETVEDVLRHVVEQIPVPGVSRTEVPIR